ncbi:hypothetical protein ACFS2C_00005 [Prauserella oleivorans]|uniref:B12-binding domain-containing protein n=1 Tax=Prauserella oleivorans TaxID=1478153 RepID=A0ABW5W3K2_9PSEU
MLVEVETAWPAAVALARRLPDEGAEVVYAGVLHTRAEVMTTVDEEDADVLVLAGASGGHRAFVDGIGAVHPGLHVLPFSGGGVDGGAWTVAEWVTRSAICATYASSEAVR